MFSQCSNQDVVWENVCLIKWTPIFIWLYWNLIGIGRCYYDLELIWKIDGFGLKLKLADVNANTMDDVNPLFHVMADVIAISWYCDSHYYLVGRCCCLIIWYRQMPIHLPIPNYKATTSAYQIIMAITIPTYGNNISHNMK